jgi:hypothetical protein
VSAPFADPRVGLFGSGTIGIDGSLEAMLRYLRAARPDAVLLLRRASQGPDDAGRETGTDDPDADLRPLRRGDKPW